MDITKNSLEKGKATVRWGRKVTGQQDNHDSRTAKTVAQFGFVMWAVVMMY